jgi:hypothetical protein
MAQILEIERNNIMIEVFKDIIGYEGIYQISNLGKVKSLDRYVTSKNDSKRFVKGRMMKLKLDRYGYETVCLSKERIAKTVKVHRIVGINYVPNPDNKPQINHISGIKTQNHVSNIEWCTPQENIQHSFDTGLNTGHGKKSVELWLKGIDDITWIFDSIMLAAKELGLQHKNLSAVVNGRLNTTGGYEAELVGGC